MKKYTLRSAILSNKNSVSFSLRCRNAGCSHFVWPDFQVTINVLFVIVDFSCLLIPLSPFPRFKITFHCLEGSRVPLLLDKFPDAFQSFARLVTSFCFNIQNPNISVGLLSGLLTGAIDLEVIVASWQFFFLNPLHTQVTQGGLA